MRLVRLRHPRPRSVDTGARVRGRARRLTQCGEGGGAHVDAGDPLGVRARFLAAVSRLESGHDQPARLCEACVEVLPVQRAAIAVHVEGAGLEILCASDDAAEKVEWTQITLGEGPGVQAVATGAPVVVADLSDPRGRWPAFAAEAVKAGVGAMYAFPLEV